MDIEVNDLNTTTTTTTNTNTNNTTTNATGVFSSEEFSALLDNPSDYINVEFRKTYK